MENNLGNKEVMAKNLQYYMEKKGIGRQELADKIGVSYSAVRDYVKGRVYPRIDKIEMMAELFGVSKADLVEPHDEDSEHELRVYYKPEWKVLIDALEEATAEDIQRAAEILTALKRVHSKNPAN